ncbi:unnamed protein product [Nezara viridula]|uniref:CFA20 domain-containing protein n=1 Tax=Nezara viridula TaxID=85310 RepID=A0A9P0MRF4_NEZVI|nr:unnamed protein product [Nezara viridula]
MYRNVFQKGLVTVFYSCGSKPLAEWRQYIKTGFLRRITDEHIRSLVLEIMSVNIVNTYITSPPDPNDSLGIKLPFLVMILKNLAKYFSFEIMIVDDRDMKRRFRVSNYQSKSRIGPFCCNMPIGLNPGWNQVQFNLAEFTRQAYGTSYVETMRLTIHANCRLRRVYFSERLFEDDELPQDFKLYRPE